uniref:Putative 8.9 kDa family member n=1 Tax=Rhipicephalus microplus TaxID=6941 RepID=A0A6G5A795_RHIMP
MLRKGRLLDLLFTTFITAHYMLYIAHCEVKIQHCEVKNGSCVYGGNKTVKDGYDILSKPPNCTQWVCNVSAEAFVITGCPPPSNHPYLALPMNAGDCFWPKCCNKSAHVRECKDI